MRRGSTSSANATTIPRSPIRFGGAACRSSRFAELRSSPVSRVTVLFDIEPELALSRVAKRGRPDAFESEGLAFMRRIAEGYRALAAEDEKRWLVVECGERTAEEIFSEMKRGLADKGLPL